MAPAVALLAVALPAAVAGYSLNQALVFIKPHAAVDSCEAFVREHLAAAGVSVVASGVKEAAEIDRLKIIDQHYGSLATLAMDTAPSDMTISEAAQQSFVDTYGVDWSAALPSIRQNGDVLSQLGIDGLTLESMWRSGVQLKLAPGTYVSRLEGPSEPLYTINGFYPAMRQAFVTAGSEVRYMVCEFDEERVPWAQFRQAVIGATDPTKAAAGSARASLLDRWEELGLPQQPSMSLNCVHASAGPLEGLKERMVWAGTSIEEDAFGCQLLEAGVSRAALESWLADNPVVTLGGQTDKIFDLTEEMGAGAVLQLCGGGGGGAAAAPAAEAAAAPEKLAAAPPSGFEWGLTV